ncbi:MAG: polysaccharide pyruvyl transferase CsaB [Clostridia bacterium]|nr:polysaccharide pyruvyl transferase CsaB [Clostridia bacterium]
MKILMTTMKMDIGGAETHILELAKALVRRGHRVTVASAGGMFVPEFQAAGIVHVMAPLHTRRPDQVLRAASILRRLIRDGGFDIVHAHARIPALLCHLLCRQYHVRFVTTAHLNFHVNFLWKLLSRWGERTIAVSDDIKQYLIDDYHICADNISVTINGINTDTYTPDLDASSVMEEFGLTKEKHRIVCVSRMDADRSEAAVQLADIAPQLYAFDPKTEILLVGEGNDFARVKAHAQKANAAVGFPMVRLTGARTDINRLIAAGEVFVGVSRAALEAMAMAKPVVLAGNQGYLGIFTKDKFDIAYDSNFCCRDCPQTNPEALYRDITTLLSFSEAEKEALGKDGREIIKEHYSVARMAQDYLDLYAVMRPYKPFRYGDYLFCGYYGFRNMGDDSLLRAMISNIQRIDPDARITVMSKNPSETRAIYGTHAIHRFSPFAVLHAMRHGKLLIFGGGNLLQDGSSARSLLYYTAILHAAKRCGLKIMVYANGIGPLHLEKSKKAAAKALSLADCITLREQDSVTECQKLGVQCPVISLTADPAFTLKEADPTWIARICTRFGIQEHKKYFVIALRDFKNHAQENIRCVAEICDEIHKRWDLTPIFLPMHDPLDRAVNRETAALCTCETVFLEGLTGSEMLGILRRMEFVAAMRLHTLIYSTAVGTPSMGLVYDRKLRAFMETTNQPYLLDSDDIDRTAFLTYAEELLDKKEEIHNRLCTQLETLRALAYHDAQTAVNLVR